MGNGNFEKTIIAEIYDKYSSEFYDHHAKRRDVQFYVNAAIESCGGALEIGCGTGRILIPTAKAGVRVTGLDNSKEMLKICREKLDGESADVRDRVDLVHADMRDFNLGRKFSLISIPFGPFNYLVSADEQIRCLNRIKSHLNDSGILVVDLWYPNLRDLWESENGADIVHKKTPFTMQDGRSVTWGIRNTSVDYNQQIIQEEMFYNVVYPDGHKEKMVYPCPMRYFFRYEVEHLLARTGFELTSVFADFDKEPFGSKYPSEMVIVACKA